MIYLNTFLAKKKNSFTHKLIPMLAHSHIFTQQLREGEKKNWTDDVFLNFDDDSTRTDFLFFFFILESFFFGNFFSFTKNSREKKIISDGKLASFFYVQRKIVISKIDTKTNGTHGWKSKINHFPFHYYIFWRLYDISIQTHTHMHTDTHTHS